MRSRFPARICGRGRNGKGLFFNPHANIDKNLLTARSIAKPCHRISNQGEDSAADIGAWIRQARARRDPAFATFAAGLDGDIAAMRAALTEPWSSGHAGGQINRLKLVKQRCYGRAGLEPLKRYMTLAV
jgi:transposase